LIAERGHGILCLFACRVFHDTAAVSFVVLISANLPASLNIPRTMSNPSIQILKQLD
jgi:hypothetical protein